MIAHRRRTAATATAVALSLVACTGETVTAEDLIHVHDLVLPDDGPPLVAAHSGLYELRDDTAVAVDEVADDLMAAAANGSGELFASGHPDLTSDRLRIEGRPPLLGLVVRSSVGWEPRSLLGLADFHALVADGDTVIGADGTSGHVLASADGGRSWDERGEVTLVVLAIAPEDRSRLVGVDLTGAVLTSTDGGGRWDDAAMTGVVDVAWTRHGMVALTGAGELVLAAGPGEDWRVVGQLPGAAALATDDGALVALVPPGSLWRSTDGGTTWTGLP